MQSVECSAAGISSDHPLADLPAWIHLVDL